MTSEKLPTLPASISIRIRDGVPNKLVDFDLQYKPEMSRPVDPTTAIPGAKTDHLTSVDSIIEGLYRAIASQAKLLYEGSARGETDWTPEKIEDWLNQMNGWAIKKAQR